MDDAFDPYFKWLAIPVEEQPPNHYRLLGVPLFTSDLDVIETLAEQRAKHIRTFQIGERGELATQLLNEIAAARACLLNPALKADYDQRLRLALESQDRPSFVVPAVTSGPSRRRSATGKRRRKHWLGSSLTTMLALALIVYAVLALLFPQADTGTRPPERIQPTPNVPSNTNPFVEVAAPDAESTAIEQTRIFGSESLDQSFGGATNRTASAGDRSSLADSLREPDVQILGVRSPRDDVRAAPGNVFSERAGTAPIPVAPQPPDTIAPEPAVNPEPLASLADKILIATNAGSGADAMVQIGVNERFGQKPSLGIRTRRGVETNHTYLRFDLGEIQPFKNEITSAEVILTLIGEVWPEEGSIRVIGVSDVWWSEDLLHWDNSFSKNRINSFPVLAQVSLRDEKANAKPGRNQIRISSPELARFVADSGDTMTLCVAGRGHDDSLLRFASHEMSDRIAPTLIVDDPRGRAEQHRASPFTNSIGMTMVPVSPGAFLMGASASDFDAADDEKPTHRVTISKPYFLSRTEVTQSQWSRVMGTSPWSGQRFVRAGLDYPATYVSWNDAVEFCSKLSAKDGRTYRLPTEAQWEYACRAGSETVYYFGDSPLSLADYAWYSKNAYDVKRQYANRVGTKRPNALGLYDMHGNVWEWCSDWYDQRYYRRSPPADPSGPRTGIQRVNRGGGWGSEATYCRASLRDRFAEQSRNPDIGFRVCITE